MLMSQLPGGATQLIKGVDKFRRKVFGTQEELFRELGKGQSPLALFITCSDSRINPNLLTQTDPGELFILRNAGNLVPPTTADCGGEEATIEYALVQLKIRDIIVCGHSHCGAMNGLLNPQALETMPRTNEWLRFARKILPELPAPGTVPPEELLDIAIERNVLLQIAHMKTHLPVALALGDGRLRLHAWVYHFEIGEVVAHDPNKGRFVPLAEAPHQQFVKEPASSTRPHGAWDDTI
jgi:carbonic anhydrase